MNKIGLLLFFPVVVLFVWVLGLEFQLSSSTPVCLPVQGFDPRDFLAGHYLAISVDYSSFPSQCLEAVDGQEAFFCLKEKKIVLNKTADCSVFIKGVCRFNKRFDDGVERFYVPQKDAFVLEKALREPENKPHLCLKVSKNGTAFPVELKLNDITFKEWLEKNKK